MSVLIKISKGTFTVTIATPAVFTLASHGLVAGDIVYLTTTGALPTGLTTGTAYYVIAAGLTTNAFQVSATLGGAAINTTGSQSGTHKLHVDRTTKVIPESFALSRAITSQVDSLKFNIARNGGASSGYKPALLDEVSVSDDSQVLFGGQIVSMDSQVVDGSDIEVFEVSCKDFTYDMDKTLVIATYQSMSIENIIADINTNFLTGYTIVNVDCPTIANYIAFNYEYPSKCFQQLAELVNYDWFVDAEKNIYFFSKSTYPAAYNLTDTSENYYYNTLVLKDSLLNLRNSVIVRGGQYLGSLTSETVVADGTALVYKQGNQYNTVFVKVNGVTKTVGIDNIDDPASYDCLYNFQEKFVRFKVATKPASPHTVEVGGYPYIPVIVKVRDVTSIATYGEHQFKIVDKSINSKEGARDRARAELAAWADTLEEGGFETMTAGLDVGTQLNVQSTIRGVDNDYVISRIATSMVNGVEFLHKVTLVTTRTWGMVEFLMQLLINKDKEIVINPDEVTDTVESATEEIVLDDGAPVVSISHNPQAETITLGEVATVQALDYAVEFTLGEQGAPSGLKRQFIVNNSILG